MPSVNLILGENDDDLPAVSPVSNSVCHHCCEVQICETNVVKQPSHTEPYSVNRIHIGHVFLKCKMDSPYSRILILERQRGSPC